MSRKMQNMLLQMFLLDGQPDEFNTAMGDCLRAGKPSRYVTSRLCQLTLPSLGNE